MGTDPQTTVQPCPFCGSNPRVERGKKGHCSLHGDPFQPIIVRCAAAKCPAKPHVAGGDVFNGGEAGARAAAIARWNTRAPLAATGDTRAWVLSKSVEECAAEIDRLRAMASVRRCECCGDPATTEDIDGVPLCAADYAHLVEHQRAEGL